MQGNEKLGGINKSLIDNPINNKYLSVASVWEMALKINSGKLKIQKPLKFYIPNEINLIDIKLSHIFNLEQIPFHHKDPFDRLIISASIIENLEIMSVDKTFSLYNINLGC